MSTRREFITLLGGAAAAWPVAAGAQQPDKVYRIGYLGLASAAAQATRMKALQEGLAALGYIEGKNIVIQERRLESAYDQLQLAKLAAQLVDLKPDVIVTHGPGALAAKHATATIPIVIAQTGDAVATGVVASLARPGGNVTGMTFFGPELAAKRLELLKEVIPDLAQAGVLITPENPMGKPYVAAMKLMARSLKLELSEFAVREPTDLEGAFAAMAGNGRRVRDDGRASAHLQCRGQREACDKISAGRVRIRRIRASRRLCGLRGRLSRHVA